MGAAQSSSSVSQQPHQRAHPRTANTVGDVDVREKQVTALLGNLGMGDDDKPQRDVPRGSGNAQITLDDIGRWQKHYDAAPVRQALATLLSKQDILASLTSRNVEILDTQVFNVQLSGQVTPITNQKQSGRCWLFAALNMARIAFAKKYNVEEFQFSQAYPFFFDHVEKSNFFLENMIDLAEDSMDSRIMSELLSSPVGDGGEWAFAVDLFERYGLIPQPLYPESFTSSNSAKMDSLVDSKLREYAFELRQLYARTKKSCMEGGNMVEAAARAAAIANCRVRKTEQMCEVYTILTMCLGRPPKPDARFKYEFYDKDKKYQSIEMTPLELYASLAPTFTPSDSFSIVHEPNHTLGKLYTVERFQNVHGGRKLLYVNTDISDLEEHAIKMLKADKAVWFACDSRMCGDRDKGIWDVNVRDIEGTFGTKLGMNKAQRLESGESYPSHAMMLSGVHLENGKPVRWRIENSWGPDYGSKGYFVCTAEWFREYVYEVIVPKSMAKPELVKILEQGDPTPLPPWGSMRKRPSKGI